MTAAPSTVTANVRARLLVTIPEACSILSIGKTHLYKLHRRGELEIVHLGAAARVRYSDLERLAGIVS